MSKKIEQLHTASNKRVTETKMPTSDDVSAECCLFSENSNVPDEPLLVNIPKVKFR